LLKTDQPLFNHNFSIPQFSSAITNKFRNKFSFFQRQQEKKKQLKLMLFQTTFEKNLNKKANTKWSKEKLNK